MSTPPLPTEAKEALAPRPERLADGTTIEPINCQALMAMAVIDSPILREGATVLMEDLLTVAALCQGDAEEWAPLIEARDAKGIRLLAIRYARSIGPERLSEISAAIQRQISRGLAGLVPLRSPGDSSRPLPGPTAGPSPRPSTTGAGRSSSSPRSCASTASRGRK
jgi:hypothetical protein